MGKPDTPNDDPYSEVIAAVTRVEVASGTVVHCCRENFSTAKRLREACELAIQTDALIDALSAYRKVRP